MRDLTAVTLFSGFGGKALGARAAGFQLVGAIEYDEAIAGVYSDNLGPHVTVGRVEETDPSPYVGIDLLMASPVCKSFSVANSKGVESAEDMAAAEGVCRWLRALRPPAFVMENVSGYRASASYKAITDTLDGLGYWWDARILNSADFGVPQTRKRLILRAVQGGFLPPLPAPTPWRGWYDAIEDLIPTLPETKPAKWQEARLPSFPDDVADDFLIGGCNTSDAQAAPGVGVSLRGEPTRCVTSSSDQWRGFLMENISTARTATLRAPSEPCHTLTAAQCGRRPGNMPLAYLLDSRNPNQEFGKLYRTESEPALTVTTDGKPSHMPRILLVGDQSSHSGRGVGIPYADAPAMTIRAGESGGSSPKVFLPNLPLLVEGGNANSNGPIGTPCGRPARTVVANSDRQPSRAWLSRGRWVAITQPCLARFQSFSDSFRLPENRKLAAVGIGNAVPPLLAEAICAGIREAL